MELLLPDPETLGSAGVSLGAVFVALAYKFLTALSSFFKTSNEVAVEVKDTLAGLRDYLDASMGHQVREEEVLRDIAQDIGVIREKGLSNGKGSNGDPRVVYTHR